MKKNSEVKIKKEKSKQNVVLLSAGSGSRMGTLTQQLPKSLLQLADKKVIDWILNAIISRTDGEIVVVVGYEANKVEQHIALHYSGRVKTVINPRYAEDVNILSVEFGVAALTAPENGYLIVETDIILEDDAWSKVFNQIDCGGSYWISKGVYNADLTGGIIQCDKDNNVLSIEYKPQYDPLFDGWAKMIGLLYVGPDQVENDRRLRQSAILDTINQYYLMPWHHSINELPARLLDLGESFAVSFNTERDFFLAEKAFLQRQE